jgi:outer membrane protein
MNKLLIPFVLILLSSQVFAQRVAFIESEYILSKVKTYAAANENIEKISQDWQKDIQDKMSDLEQQYKKFQAEQSLYTNQMKQDKIKEIESAEKEIASLQQKRFGPNGDLFKKRQELLQPITNKMIEEIQKIAEKKSFDLVMDKSSGATIVFSNPKLNISEDVIKAMGY